MKRVSAPPRLRRRPTDANKVTVGRVLVVGGSPSLRGAPALAALGALRAGAGLVQVAVPHGIQDTVAAYRPETTTTGLPATRAGALGAAALPVLRDLAPAWDCVVLGPGAGRAPATLALVRALASACTRPLVLDADALFAFNERLGDLRGRDAPTVLTPHEGEAARLLGCSSADVKAQRKDVAARLAAQSGAVIVLKGPGTLVTDGTRMYRNRSGGPVLATGGSGDVLAGVVAALIAHAPANGTDIFQATCAAVYAHGAAAERVAGEHDRGLLASELAAGLPDALLALTRSRAR